jgi:hypothetical protein
MFQPGIAARIRTTGSSRTVWSPGWGTEVILGSGQAHVFGILETVADRERGIKWHDAPPMREFGRSPSVVHQHLHRLAALGVIAIQTTLGRYGGVRFTFRGRRWKFTAPARRVLTMARMKMRDVREAIGSFLHAPIRLFDPDVRTPSKKDVRSSRTLTGPTFGEFMAAAGCTLR